MNQQLTGSHPTNSILSDDLSPACPLIPGTAERVPSAPGATDVPTTVQRLESALDELERLEGLLIEELDYEVPRLRIPMPEDFRLSIVVPVYNERDTLGPIVARLARIPLRKEILLVDDGSTDGTRDLLRRFEQVDECRVVYKPRNEGKGAALRSGFERVTGDVVVIQDADLEYDPRDIPRLIEPIVRGDADVVYGSRFLAERPQDPSWLHRAGNALLTEASNLLTGLTLTDMETCYKAFRGDVLAGISLRQDRFGFEPEITAKLARHGYRILELPISYDGRGYDEGKKIGIKDAFEALYCIVRYGLAD